MDFNKKHWFLKSYGQVTCRVSNLTAGSKLKKLRCGAMLSLHDG
jgi:hypothetical protein